MRSISTVTALAVLFSSAALSVVAAGTASAATTAHVTAPGGFVADDAVKRVFVGDNATGIVAATDYSGAVLGSVSGITGVSDIAVSDDGATVYAAAPGSHEIVAIDAATLDVKARYAVATDYGPRHVAFSSGKVWFTYGDQWDGDLGSVDPTVDPASGTNPVTMAQFPTEGTSPGLWGQALLDTDPLRPGVLAIGQSGVSTDSMAVVDVSSGTPKLTAWYFGDYTLNSGIGDIDLAAGTDEVLVNGTDRDAYADGKFSKAGAYPAGQLADVARDGLVAQVAGGRILTYRPNATKALHTYDMGTQRTAGLAWAPDTSRLFALVGTDAGNGGYTLKVLTDPTKNNPTLTVNAPSTAPRAKKLTVTGKLSASYPLPTGVRLQVTRTDLDSPNGKTLPAVTVNADGTYSFSDTPPAGGTVTYKVSYAGDDVHSAVSASDKVAVSRTATTLSLNNNGKLYSYGADVTFTAHLGATYRNRTVEIWANPYGGDKPNKLLKTGTVNSSGNISAVVDMTRDTDVTAVFKGDARYAPKTVKATGYARVKVSTAVTKNYKKAAIGSQSYYWFHKSTSPVVTTTMTYYPGRKQRLELEVYYNGKWYATDGSPQYFSLATNGRSTVNMGAPGRSGVKARVRAAYINNSSGDNVNSNTYSDWKYLYFSN
ncbi:YncE family protein [Streptomyces guryensis]|uniref:Ig-like domain repeat protein n=1 Tax=Streptomyces guryensis TaxID=2886947 RepID=A0A9Q3VTU1_9ACTN|nr:Ig-like domain repeat protein [Streptomyces guryensis]MCD9876835.1 Ig-like domain repeat protein [Streptomyces guryensis]